MKLLKLVAALAGIPVAAAVMAVGPLGVHTASAAPKRLIECRSMAQSPSAPVEVSGCNRPGLTGGSGTQLSCPVGVCLTWSTGKETNFSFTRSAPSTSRCPVTLYEIDVVGTVASVSGSWTKRFIGQPVAFAFCATNRAQVIELVPGTVFTIG
jgi:hypothetical protein